jgi:hypothetical protein
MKFVVKVSKVKKKKTKGKSKRDKGVIGYKIGDSGNESHSDTL